MKIRRARLSDVSAIYRLGKADLSREEWFNRGELGWIIRSNPRSCWVLENDGRVVGARLTCEAWGRTAWGWLILIKDDMRRQKLGTFLFNETCKLLRKAGMNRIMTDVYVKNTTSVKWHRKMGYRELGRVRDWFSKGKDAVIVCKEF